MTKTKKASVIWLVFLICFFVGRLILFGDELPSSSSDQLTLKEAIKRVLTNNASVKKTTEAISILTARVGGSRSNLWPKLQTVGNYTRLGPVPELTIPKMGTFKFYPANNFDLHLAAHQLLFDNHRTREAINLSQAQVTEALDRLEVLKRDLSFGTAELFYSILYLKESLRVKTEHLQTLHKHLEAAEKKLEAGTATELDLLNIKVRMASTENIIADLKNNLEKQELRLKQLMGQVDNKPLELAGSFATEKIKLDEETLIQEALKQRMEMKTVEDQIKIASLGLDFASLHNKPSVSLNLMGGLKNGFIPNLNTMKFNFAAALEVDVPIFDGHLTQALKAEAEANLRVSRSQQQEVEDMIKTEVLEALSDLKSSEQKLNLVEVNLQQAKKALDYARSHYEAGTITNLDLMDTEDAYTEAEFIRLQAIYQFTLSLLSLQKAVGREVLAD
ncbi:MAG: TolC family protein [Candidatus Saccharicenans sp.]